MPLDLSHEETALLVRAVAGLQLLGFTEVEMSTLTCSPYITEILDRYSAEIGSHRLEFVVDISEDKDAASKALFDRTVLTAIQFYNDVLNGGTPKGAKRSYEPLTANDISTMARLKAAESLIKTSKVLGVIDDDDIGAKESIPAPKINTQHVTLEKVEDGQKA